MPRERGDRRVAADVDGRMLDLVPIVFRLLPDGTNERALAVAQIQNNQVTVIDPAPRRFGGAGF